MNTNSIQKIHIPLEQVVFSGIVACFIAAFSFYMYNIMATVAETVLRQEIEIAIRNAETQVSDLEGRYFARANELTRDVATEYGLVASAPTAYVPVSSENVRLTRND